jgi:hypothetical protein
MPLQKTEQVTRIATDDADHRTRIRFYRADANAAPPKHLRVNVELFVSRSDGAAETISTDKHVADTTLTVGERAALAAILQKLVAEAAADAGFVNVQALQGK